VILTHVKATHLNLFGCMGGKHEKSRQQSKISKWGIMNIQDEHKELHHNILSDFTHQCKQI